MHFFRHTMQTVLHINGMYKSEGNVRSPLGIIPLSHMIKCRQGSTQPKLGSMNMVFFSLCTCLQWQWLRHRTRQKPLMSNLQLVEQLTNYSDSERASSLSGPVHNQSPHSLSYPFVTVVRLNLLMRMECIFLYSLAISKFYLLLLVSYVTSWNSAEINIMSVVCLSLSTLHVAGTGLSSFIY